MEYRDLSSCREQTVWARTSCGSGSDIEQQPDPEAGVVGGWLGTPGEPAWVVVPTCRRRGSCPGTRERERESQPKKPKNRNLLPSVDAATRTRLGPTKPAWKLFRAPEPLRAIAVVPRSAGPRTPNIPHTSNLRKPRRVAQCEIHTAPGQAWWGERMS